VSGTEEEEEKKGLDEELTLLGKPKWRDTVMGMLTVGLPLWMLRKVGVGGKAKKVGDIGNVGEEGVSTTVKRDGELKQRNRGEPVL